MTRDESNSALSSFDKLFKKEMMESELLRAKLLFGIFGFSAFTFGVLTFLFPNNLFYIYSFQFPKYIPVSFFSAIAMFYFLLSKRIGFAIKNNIEVRDYVRYFGTIMETTIPSIAIFFLGNIYGKPVVGLLTPPAFVYFFFIILSTLRLDSKLCILTGVVAGLEYIGLTFYSFKNTIDISNIDPVLSNPPIYIAKSVMLVIGGIIAGFVTNQIRVRIFSSFHALEERNRITNIFGQHVSPLVVEKLLSQSSEFTSEVKHVCMMFFDIRDFTSFSEKRNPEEVVNYLNSLFEHIIKIINENGGIINKFLGDGFMAVFGAPISSGEDVENAVRASQQILNKIQELESSGEIPITKIGIGLHCGNAVTGNVGSLERKEYTIIGDVVNLASRIEQLNKQFQSKILISEEVFSNLKNKTGVLCGDVIVKGRTEPVKLYRID
ncbi:MAG: adenylate/guanylate cyclase domain-containing protein [Leptospiraceae bacterium]|nr:adenylate/guanylate cyclase domain-containing protein [Leptospiraceae bacterium]